MQILLRFNNVDKRFAKKVVLNNISFEIQKGDLIGLIGNNGAGKSTTIKITLGLLKADSGLVSLYGQNSYNLDNETKKKIGVVFDNPCLINKLDAYSNIKYFSKHYNLTDKQIEKRYKELANIFKFEPGQKKVSELSKGMRQKLNIIRAFIHDPEFVILDEPFSGLDIQSQIELKKYIKILKESYNLTMLISSHNLNHLEDLADSILLINNGKIEAHENTKKIVEGKANEYVLIFPNQITEDLEIRLRALEELKISKIESNKCEIMLIKKDTGTLIEILSKNQIYPSECIQKRVNLESFYLSHYKGELNEY